MHKLPHHHYRHRDSFGAFARSASYLSVPGPMAQLIKSSTTFFISQSALPTTWNVHPGKLSYLRFGLVQRLPCVICAPAVVWYYPDHCRIDSNLSPPGYIASSFAPGAPKRLELRKCFPPRRLCRLWMTPPLGGISFIALLRGYTHIGMLRLLDSI